MSARHDSACMVGDALSKRWEDVEDIEKCRTADTLDRDRLLVAIDLRRKSIAGPMI